MKRPVIQAKNIQIGKNTIIEPTVIIRGVNGEAQRIAIGDNVYIGDHVQIICSDFTIGDYSKIHHHTNIHGYKACLIGHNAWIGQYSIIDCIGGTSIGDNCGIGAHSQLWSHIKYGDMLAGCRFNSERELNIGKDVWFVGHCIVSPITAHDKSMALVGSVVTQNMQFNTVYAGVPAKPISDKVGTQFADISLEEKIARLNHYLVLSGAKTNEIAIVAEVSEIRDDGRSYFCVSSRTYTKRGTTEEIKFMKYLLPDKAKFTPHI